MRYSILAALLIFGSACAAAPPPPPKPSGPAENEITAESLTTHVKVLASDDFQGRAPATPGGKLATEYLANQMAALGLQPAGANGTFFPEVPIVESTVEESFVLSVPGNTYRYFKDVVAFSGVEKPRVQVQGEVVFVGHGINAPELKWND